MAASRGSSQQPAACSAVSSEMGPSDSHSWEFEEENSEFLSNTDSGRVDTGRWLIHGSCVETEVKREPEADKRRDPASREE